MVCTEMAGPQMVFMAPLFRQSRITQLSSSTSKLPTQAASLVFGRPQQMWTVCSCRPPLYRIVVREADPAELALNGRSSPDKDSDAQMNATFISTDGTGTELRYIVGVRNRGHGSRNRQPNNYRVNFRNHAHWKGVTAINLNGHYTYAQVMGSALFLHSGVPVAQARAVQVRVNHADLSFSGASIGASTNGFKKFDADNSPGKRANHTNFELAAGGEAVGLFAVNGTAIDSVVFGAEAFGISEGHLPHGSATIARLMPTPSARNQGVDSQNPDTDGDGLPNDWELANGLNPNDPSDAQKDSDHDGFTNLAEYLSGTDPLDPKSNLKISEVLISAGKIVLRFAAVANRTYTVQANDSLANNGWVKLSDIPAEPNTHTAEITDSLSIPTDSDRYYRLVTPSLP